MDGMDSLHTATGQVEALEVSVATITIGGPGYRPDDEEQIAEAFGNLRTSCICVQGIGSQADLQRFARAFKTCGRGYSSHRASGAGPVLFSSIPVLETGTTEGRVDFFDIDLRDTKGGEPEVVRLFSARFDPANPSRRRRSAETVGGYLTRADPPSIFVGDSSSPSFERLRAPANCFDAWREKGTPETGTTDGRNRMDRIWWAHPRLWVVKYGVCPPHLARKGAWCRFELEPKN